MNKVGKLEIKTSVQIGDELSYLYDWIKLPREWKAFASQQWVSVDALKQELQRLKVMQDLEHTHPSIEFWKGWNKAIERLLALLDGDSK